ncbi:elongation factor P [Qipengyuania sp. ASV99]|uniref:elongation factor P n=1 Tax=Qipengyuania sp. ASV99 TaxID=3399681 RepID=UPI003A4C5138
MKTIHIAILTAFAAGIAATAPAIGKQENAAAPAPPSGGMLRTLPHGTYQCALPGDAGGAAFVAVEEQDFRIFTASRYETADGAGTYILRGDEVTFTRGPRKGERFRQVSENQLRKLNANGEDSDLLCTRLGSG